MKVYLVRHQDRVNDCSMFAPLSEFGILRSIKLSKLLKKLRINQIYASPFIRTLSTVQPFAIKYNIPIKFEYGLCDYNVSTIIPSSALGQKIPDYIAKYYNYDKNYNSIYDNANFGYDESSKEITSRSLNILNNIIINHKYTSDRILIVTHSYLCSIMLSYLSMNIPYNSILEQLKIKEGYPMGQLVRIYKNSWNFKVLEY